MAVAGMSTFAVVAMQYGNALCRCVLAAGVVTKRRSLDRDQSVDRERFGMSRHVGDSIKSRPTWSHKGFAQTKDTTRADVDASLAERSTEFPDAHRSFWW